MDCVGDSGDITPVSGCSEVDCNTNDATAGSTADADVTMTEDFEASEEDVVGGGRTTPLPDGSGATQVQSTGDTGVVCVDARLNPGNVTSAESSTLTKNKNNSKEHVMLKRLSSLNLEPSTTMLSSPETRSLNILSNNLNSNPSHIELCSHLKHIENAERIQNTSLPSTSSHRTTQLDIEGNLQKHYGRFCAYQKSHSVADTANRNTPSPGMYEKDYNESSKNISGLGSDKWCTSKEKFLDSSKLSEPKTPSKSNQYNLMNEVFEKKITDVAKNLNVDDVKTKCEKAVSNELHVPKVNLGAVVVKESFIEPPRMTRISKSFHGKTSNSSNLNIASGPRRASDSVSSLSTVAGGCSGGGGGGSNLPGQSDTSTSTTQPSVPIQSAATLKNIFPGKVPKSPRRASDATAVVGKNKSVNVQRQFMTQLSQPCTSSSSSSSLSMLTTPTRKASLNASSVIEGRGVNRFTTTLVDEAEHAASNWNRRAGLYNTSTTTTTITADNTQQQQQTLPDSSSSVMHGFNPVDNTMLYDQPQHRYE